jgi:anti-sigma regulatory factor (Ser/Thr protein kinase)
VVAPDGSSRFLEHPLGLPIGVLPDVRFDECRTMLAPGSILLLYTDGLVEDRELPLDEGLERLREAMPGERWIEGLVERMTARREVDDDVAALALQVEVDAAGLFLRRPSLATELVGIREAVRDALAAAGIGGPVVDDLVLAASEAAGNVVRHAYGGEPGPVEVTMQREADTVRLTIRDQGSWKHSSTKGRRGLEIMQAVTDEATIQKHKTGTTVTLERRLTPDN